MKTIQDPKRIKKEIAAAFSRMAQVDASTIKVDVTGGHAILSGTVRSTAEKKFAEKAAWCAPGITQVDNRIEIAPEDLATGY